MKILNGSGAVSIQTHSALAGYLPVANPGEKSSRLSVPTLILPPQSFADLFKRYKKKPSRSLVFIDQKFEFYFPAKTKN